MCVHVLYMEHLTRVFRRSECKPYPLAMYTVRWSIQLEVKASGNYKYDYVTWMTRCMTNVVCSQSDEVAIKSHVSFF